MIARRLLLASPALLLARRAVAQELTWNGVPAQGGLLRGQALAGTRLALDGRAVRVSPEGYFALGFSRDHDPSATLSITKPDGRREEMRLPVAKRDWDVQRITGLPGAMVTPDEAALRRITAERAQLAAARGVDNAGTGFMAPMAWPARGRISGIYGSQRILNGQPRQPHYGLDIAAPTGTPISAALPGRVTLSGDFFFFGQILVLDHGHGVNTLYAHLSQRIANEGDVVARGDRIALMGATGRVTGPHLHFSLSWYQTFLDPQPLLPAEQG
ncbi:M23 family metallopeptidase [Falsiroseomonas tokyonensis]|uniref:M23 family metallopeptidase n=1 Tax=Falsiroseomonas tokyonensis TaxID=430521 RepID=A0ABV7C309_9PROT|nr:M23 family metallopeptidase [Falsiroseomonas tokyonensis]MBU8541020.1 M23 family metallopeptidase [Falsiroseomonas tokyonensis]